MVSAFVKKAAAPASLHLRPRTNTTRPLETTNMQTHDLAPHLANLKRQLGTKIGTDVTEEDLRDELAKYLEYGVPVDQLLPQIERGKTTVPSWSSGGVTIDLGKLEKTAGTTAEILERFLRAIQIMRQDFNGRVLTIRRSDLQLLAGLLEEDEEALGDMLVNIGAADAGTA